MAAKTIPKSAETRHLETLLLQKYWRQLTRTALFICVMAGILSVVGYILKTPVHFVGWFMLASTCILLLAGSFYAVTKYRIDRGTFGENEAEALELMEFARELSRR